jgi:putative endopeptidase
MKIKKVLVSIAVLGGILGGIAFISEKPTKGIETSSVDKSVKPGDDFYRYANGNWLKNNPIPASESRWGSFNIVAERNNIILKQLLEDAAVDKSAKQGSSKNKVGILYRLFMDTLKRETQGIQPIAKDLGAINAVQNKEQLVQVIGTFHKKGIRCFFGFYIGQDLKNSTSYIAYISQGGLGLPDRDYYLKTDSKSISIRNEYTKHIETISDLFGFGGKNIASQAVAFETALAKSSMNRTERRNQEKQYNKRAFKQVMNDYPQVNLGGYMQHLQVSSFDSLIVSQPDFFATLNQLIVETPLEEIKAYLKWCLMNNASGYLDSKLEKQNFYFYGTVLTGAKEQKPIWKRGIAAANNVVGELLGQLFVEKTFSPASKQRVNAMVDDIVEAFKVRINNLSWMSNETKGKALIKLASFNRKFGYPDKWKDYSSLEIKDDSYIDNVYRANEFGFKEMIENLGKPIDRGRWGMLPQTVNAYYSPTLNEIVFPAAIMQPPFFDASADDAVNYGSIGAVIGHELTHGFDDQGAKYGADGNLKSWWSDEDKKLFEAKTKVLVDQFNGYFVTDSIHVNGELTLGENIADIGGLTIAYEAFQMRLKKNPGKVINGYTPEQRFFIGFAQIWKNNIRPEALRNLILTDPHSPGEFRVFGPLSNMPQFYEAFQIKEGDKMYRPIDSRANIW